MTNAHQEPVPSDEDKHNAQGHYQSQIEEAWPEDKKAWYDDQMGYTTEQEAYNEYCEEEIDSLLDEEYGDPGEMDGDAASALASAGWGTDEDYNHYEFEEDIF